MQLTQQIFIWDGVPLSPHDAIGWGCTCGWIPAALRASVFEAIYFSMTLICGPGWPFRSKRARFFQLALTILNDGSQGASALGLAGYLFCIANYANFFARMLVML